MDILIKHGAKVNQQDTFGQTALHYASYLPSNFIFWCYLQMNTKN